MYLRIWWHEITCPGARHGASVIKQSTLGRIYDCGCGFYVMQAFRA